MLLLLLPLPYVLLIFQRAQWNSVVYTSALFYSRKWLEFLVKMPRRYFYLGDLLSVAKRESRVTKHVEKYRMADG